MIDNLIGANLKRIRKSRKLSQGKLAEMVGTTKGFISDVETCKKGRAMGKELMTRLCMALNIEPYEFFLTIDSPLLVDEREKKFLKIIREAESAGLGDVADALIDYTQSIINKKKN